MDMQTSISQRAVTDFFVGYCQDRGINVHFKKMLKCAACDNRGNLYLPFPSAVGSDQFWWDAYHEGGHLDPAIRWTMDLFVQFSKDPRKHLVLNILVDYLSEKNRHGYFRGRDRAMYEGRIAQNKAKPDILISWKDRPLVPAMFAIDMDMRESWQGPQYKPVMPVEAEPYYETMKGMSLMTRLESIADNKDGDDLVALVNELVELEPKQQEDNDDQQGNSGGPSKSGKGSPNGPQQDGDGTGGDSQDSMGEEAQDSKGNGSKAGKDGDVPEDGKPSHGSGEGEVDEDDADTSGASDDNGDDDGEDSSDDSSADDSGTSPDGDDSPSDSADGDDDGDDDVTNDTGSGSSPDDCNDGPDTQCDSPQGGGWGAGGFSEEDKNTVLEEAGLNDNPSKAHPELDEHDRYNRGRTFNYIPDMKYVTNDITRNTYPRPHERSAIDKINANSTVHKQIQRYLLTLKASHYQHGMRRGKISGRSLHRMFNNNPMPPAVFKRKMGQSIDTDTAVSLLIDCSDSMNNANKYITACACALSLSETLRDIRVPYAVCGHTTCGCPGVGVKMHLYKRWDEGNVTRDTLLDRFSTSRTMNWNSDGEAIMYAAEDLMSQGRPKNVLIVLSDGQPCGSGHGDGGWYLKQVVTLLGEVPNLTVYGIGIMEERVKYYYDNVCVVHDPNELDGALLPIMRDAVLKGGM